MFDTLLCITGYDDIVIGSAYNLFSLEKGHYIEVRVEVANGISVPSIAHLWRAADWHEREAFDMMGISFINHPNMKRILLPDDWEGHPLKKDYKVQDYYHGMYVPKDKTEWE